MMLQLLNSIIHRASNNSPHFPSTNMFLTTYSSTAKLPPSENIHTFLGIVLHVMALFSSPTTVFLAATLRSSTFCTIVYYTCGGTQRSFTRHGRRPLHAAARHMGQHLCNALARGTPLVVLNFKPSKRFWREIPPSPNVNEGFCMCRY
jgi:hypothetical protein